MKVNRTDTTVPVSFRIEAELMARLRRFTEAETWPPPPSQTDIVERGIRIVLDNLEPSIKRRGKPRAQV